MANPLSRIIRNGRRFVAHCRVQHTMEQRADDRVARALRNHVRDALRRQEAADAIRDGCR